MDAFLISILLAMVLGVGGTFISLRLLAHGTEHVSRPRSERRVHIALTDSLWTRERAPDFGCMI
jgi:hypothetical protein